MQKLLHCVLAGAMLLLAAAPVQAAGGHGVPVSDTTLPLVASGGGTNTGGWVSLTLLLDGSPASAYVQAIDIDLPIGPTINPVTAKAEVKDPRPAGFRGWNSVYDFGSHFGETSNDVTIATEHGETGVESPVLRETGPTHKASAIYKFNMQDDDRLAPIAGKVRVVLLSPVPAASWTWTVRGGAQILAQDTGNEVFSYTAKDFEAPLNAQAKTQIVQGHAVLEGVKRVQVENTLFATFAKTFCNVWCKATLYLGINGVGVVNPENAVNTLSIVAPNGAKRNCTSPQTIYEGCFMSYAAAGSWTFRVNGIDGGVDPTNAQAGNAEVYLFGADVRLTPW